LWNLFSPLTLFSLALGAGGAGLLALLYLAPIWSIPLAAVGGWAFYRLAVRPVWALIFRFASKPSQALEGTTGKSAEAVSAFDARGRGIVRLSIDGESVRVLARLDPDDVAAGTQVRPGDTLVVTQVDARSNACTVTRL
jgi:membrane protein implicated in regulation of membrane protease activity